MLKNQKLIPVPISSVSITDKFWSPKMDTFRTIMVNDILNKFEDERGGAVKNFDRVARGEKNTHFGYWFYDGQFFEALRGAADFLAFKYDEKLDKKLDAYINRIAAAQAMDPDGYINSWVTLRAPEKRWGKNGGDRAAQHELYNAGCLVEAGVHHYQATAKTNLLSLAVKFANYLCEIIGPQPKNPLFTDHPLAEEAFVKLYQLFLLDPELSEKHFPEVDFNKYLELARFWIDQRGKNDDEECFSEYQMADVPLMEREEIAGHSVISALLCAGLTAVAWCEEDKRYQDVAQKMWESAVFRKLYLNGGAGTGKGGEGFGPDYDLPNDGYLESCAAVAMGFWHANMNILFADAKYIDELERVLYNGALVGISLKGDNYYYSNPLVCDNYNRWSWHECPCCPPMLLKLYGSLPGYIYAFNKEAIYINLFIESTATININENNVVIQQQTNYPWDGKVKITLNPEAKEDFLLNIRVPGWAKGKAIDGDLYSFTNKETEPVQLKINGKITSAQDHNGYLQMKKRWCQGDVVEVEFPMPVRKIISHPDVIENENNMALQRGPLIYCFESKDNPDGINNFYLTKDSEVFIKHEKNLLGGVTVIKGKAAKKFPNQSTQDQTEFSAVPYYAWNNRGPGQMLVWQSTGEIPEIVPTETLFYNSTEIGILSDNREIDIRYTLDGTKPDSTSPVYQKAIEIFKNTTIKAQYFNCETALGPVISNEYKKMEPREPENPTHLKAGVQVSIFKAKWKERDKIDEMNPKESLMTKKVKYLDFALGENFVVVFKGFIEIKYEECYSFGIYTPAAAQLFIGEEEVVNHTGSNGAKERKGQIVLGKGKHAFKLMCVQRGNEYERTLDLTYECPSLKKQIVSPDVFYLKVNEV